MKPEFSRQIFEEEEEKEEEEEEENSDIKFHENVSGNRVIPCGHTDRRTDMTKQIVAFRNFENAPKKKEDKIITVFTDVPNFTLR